MFWTTIFAESCREHHLLYLNNSLESITYAKFSYPNFKNTSRLLNSPTSISPIPPGLVLIDVTKDSVSRLKPLRICLICSSYGTKWPIVAILSTNPCIFTKYPVIESVPCFVDWSWIRCWLILALDWEVNNFSK